MVIETFRIWNYFISHRLSFAFFPQTVPVDCGWMRSRRVGTQLISL